MWGVTGVAGVVDTAGMTDTPPPDPGIDDNDDDWIDDLDPDGDD